MSTIMNPIFEFFQHNHALAHIESAINSKSANLILEDLDLEKLPESLSKCAHLSELYLGHNKLQDISPYMITFRNLQTLAIDYNNLDKFPTVLKELTQLKFLNISHNPISDLTENIGYLISLENLWCNSCCLTTIPNEIGNLKQLDTFGARNNYIYEVSPGFCKLPRLRWLTLNNNKLSSLPENFKQLENLMHVNLTSNNFNEIPPQFCDLKRLRYLLLQHNEVLSVDESILEELKHVVKINLVNNPIQVSIEVLGKFTNLILPGADYEQSVAGSDSDSDLTDWEDSMESTEIDFGHFDETSDDEEGNAETIPKLSKYLVTY